MDFIQIGLEDETGNQVPQDGQDVDLNPSETEQAAAAIQNRDSTEPGKQIQVANYKEELAILQQQKANEQEDNPDDNQEASTTDAATTTEEGEGESTDTPPDDGEDTPEEPTDEDNSDENSEEESEEEAEPTNTDAEMGADGVDKPAEQVAQEQHVVMGQRMVAQALESVYVMGKYHDFLSKRCELGGVSHHTAKVITNAFEHHAAQCGYNLAAPMPAMESFTTYSGSANSSQELKVAIEGFLGDVWTAIKKFFKSIWTWIMDLLTKKPENTMSPADRAARDKAVKALAAENEKLLKQLERANNARERDEARKGEAEAERLRRESREATARLNQKIAAQLFKTSDKGSFTEISHNARQLSEVVSFAQKFAVELTKILKLAGMSAIQGKQVPVENLAISKNSIGGLTFNEVKRGAKSAVYTGATDEILGGLGARFIFGGSDVKSIAKVAGAPKVIQELGQQGFRMISVKEKSGFPTRMPELDSSERNALTSIVTDVNTAYLQLTKIQEVAVEMAKIIKENSEGSEPASWQQLDKQTIAVLQMQLNFVGLLETNLVAGYKSLNDQVNNFKNTYMRLIAMYITD